MRHVQRDKQENGQKKRITRNDARAAFLENLVLECAVDTSRTFIYKANVWKHDSVFVLFHVIQIERGLRNGNGVVGLYTDAIN